MVIPTTKRSLAGYHKMHGNRTPFEKALEVARAVRAKKIKMGIEMDYDASLDVDDYARKVADYSGTIEIVDDDY